ncbi:SDR family oxidoreductase [Candidatus Mycosynbacter amalyticus]|uniref:SDR family oxidoreductase n=1 Tax=Candidatus Mycosynbacter amalyticus TaxID=2665156 RepID=A0A857MNB5_9BACT|nr:SDR family oxidoreductase [Candidatus Mycosynbacter amalyticus]QHN42641.1 SDR family oxidoreductase [Candidatus Mycosynbacter amalyticus]
MTRTQHTMQDPRSQYPALDIPEQRQKEPGLDSELQPKADHGETTYVGSGKLQGRKALISGADSGIGRAVAIAFAREGADVAITYLPSEQNDAEETLRIISKEAGETIAIPGDLSEETFAQDLPNNIMKAFGGLDIIVNNAGKQIYCDDITKLSTDQLDATFRTNIYSMFWIVQSALEFLPPGASIINTTSIQSYQPSAGLLDYASTKGAITSFTKGLSAQLIERGIRVNAVAPGPIWTPLQPSFGQPMEKLTHFGEQSPYGRAGQPAECAPAYVFLASQESSYTTGEVIGVTGGNWTP